MISCGSKVGTGGGIEYIFPFHLGLGIGWLAGFSLDITRMLGSILSPCQHFMGFSRHSIKVSDNSMIYW